MANMTMADWQTLSERINRVAPSATLAVDSKAKAMKAEGIDVIGFGAGEPNFPTPAAIVAAAAEAVQDPKTIVTLRRQVCRNCARRSQTKRCATRGMESIRIR